LLRKVGFGNEADQWPRTMAHYGMQPMPVHLGEGM
jgi:hypothetical protein